MGAAMFPTILGLLRILPVTISFGVPLQSFPLKCNGMESIFSRCIAITTEKPRPNLWFTTPLLRKVQVSEWSWFLLNLAIVRPESLYNALHTFSSFEIFFFSGGCPQPENLPVGLINYSVAFADDEKLLRSSLNKSSTCEKSSFCSFLC